MKKLLLITLTVVLCFSLAACGGNPDKSSAPQDSNQAVEDDSKLESDQAAPNSNLNPVEDTDTKNDTDTNTKTGNILLDTEFKTAPVLSGSGDNIGTYGYVAISKDELKAVTNEQMAEFVQKKVDGSDYNWVSIKCNDGTGICFAGAIAAMATYGTVDKDGCVEGPIGYLMKNSDDLYDYEAAE